VLSARDLTEASRPISEQKTESLSPEIHTAHSKEFW